MNFCLYSTFRWTNVRFFCTIWIHGFSPQNHFMIKKRRERQNESHLPTDSACLGVAGNISACLWFSRSGVRKERLAKVVCYYNRQCTQLEMGFFYWGGEDRSSKETSIACIQIKSHILWRNWVLIILNHLAKNYITIGLPRWLSG